MASEKEKLTPAKVAEVKAAAAKAMEETLSKAAMDALMNARPEDVIEANPDAEIVKGNAQRSSGWLHGPAHLQMLAMADRRLTRVAGLMGMNVKKVEKVVPRMIKGTKLVMIKPAPVTDLTAVPVNRYGKSNGAWINLISLLGDAGLTVDSGYKERYDVAYVPQASPFYPALVIDLSDVKERRKEEAKESAPESTQP